MKKCPDCGMNNGEERLFCGSCGEPLGGKEKLVRDLEKSQQARNEKISDAKFNPYENRDNLKVSRTVQYNEATEFKKLSTKKKESSNAWIFWVILFVIAIAIGCFLLFK